MSGPTWTSTEPEWLEGGWPKDVAELFSKTFRADRNHLFGEGDRWYFIDETGTDACGPYPTEQKAQEACSAYAKTI